MHCIRVRWFLLFFFGFGLVVVHQQRKLMRSSAQIDSGVCRCGWQAQIPEGSGRLVRVQGQVQVAGTCSRFRKGTETNNLQSTTLRVDTGAVEMSQHKLSNMVDSIRVALVEMGGLHDF